jgi:NADH-quinone oxidoreductase subunit L
MPLTFVTFSIGALALAGLPPLSGWFSKDDVLVAVFNGRHPIFFALALLAAFLSALYMARVWFLVFFGRLRDEQQQARESPKIMTVPLVLLGIFALTAGFLALPYGQDYDGFGSFLYYGHPERYHLNLSIALASVLLVGAGLATGWALYIKGVPSPEAIRQRLNALHRLLVNKYYMDAAYQWVIDHIVLVVARSVALFDRLIVNDAGVTGTGLSVVLSGFRLRYLETGKVYNYALGIVSGVIVGILLWWVVLT